MPDRVGHRSVLVVDDDPIVRSVVATLFSRFGYPVVVANDSNDAAWRIQHTDYDLVVSDFDMPDINGYQLACRIKQKNGRTRAVIMTGNGLTQAFQYAGCREVDGWLFKPFDFEAISNVMETLQLPNAFALRGSQGRRQAVCKSDETAQAQERT